MSPPPAVLVPFVESYFLWLSLLSEGGFSPTVSTLDVEVSDSGGIVHLESDWRMPNETLLRWETEISVVELPASGLLP